MMELLIHTCMVAVGSFIGCMLANMVAVGSFYVNRRKVK